MKKVVLFHFFAFLLLSCQSGKIERTLMNDFSVDIPLVNDIDDLFDNTGRIIHLDTIAEALVGRIGKIIKRDNQFYILSDDRRIIHFDNDGKLISLLDKRGGGPGEYASIGDFNLFNNNGTTELWLCDFNKIRKYVRSEKSWDLTGTIDFDFVIHKFKIISNEFVLFVTGQNEESLLLTDISGAPLQTYLKTEFPFLMFKAVQFINYDSCIIFQLGFSNECVSFDTKDLSFKQINIINHKRFLSSTSLLDMYNRLGIEYLGELPNTNNIRGFRCRNNQILLDYKYQGENFIAVRRQNAWKRIRYDRERHFIMATLMFSESYDTYILYEYPEEKNMNLTLYEYEP